jgi:hypothetical protein
MSKIKLTLEKFDSILNDLEIFDLNNWNKMEIHHFDSLSDDISIKEHRELFKNELLDKRGIYLYQNLKGDCLYVGKAKNLYDRVYSHFKEAYTPNESKGKVWNEFFKQHPGKLNLYWLEVESSDDILRHFIENRIADKFPPLFEISNPRLK